MPMNQEHERQSPRSTSARAHARRVWVRVIVTITSAIAIGTAWACASVPDETRFTNVYVGDSARIQEQFAGGVSFFLERRCGTLDCHGQAGRPLRIYGNRGLRLRNDGGLTPSTGDTTPQEITANYRSVVGLEPEEFSRVIAANGRDADKLLLVRKPLGIDNRSGVAHKGGSVVQVGAADDGYACLITWLEGNAALDRCQNAANAF